MRLSSFPTKTVVGLALALSTITCSAPAPAASLPPLRWIDLLGYKAILAWDPATRWNALLGSEPFQYAFGIGTELRPKPTSFWAIPTCEKWGQNELVNGCVDDDRDIHYRTDRDAQYTEELLIHEMGHTIGPGYHHRGRGVMADAALGGTPTGCLTLDDYDWMCSHLTYHGHGEYCGVPNPEC